MVKNAVLMVHAIDTIVVFNFPASFGCILGKDTAIFSALLSEQAALNFSDISELKLKKQNKEFHADSNILAYPKASRSNC